MSSASASGRCTARLTDSLLASAPRVLNLYDSASLFYQLCICVGYTALLCNITVAGLLGTCSCSLYNTLRVLRNSASFVCSTMAIDSELFM